MLGRLALDAFFNLKTLMWVVDKNLNQTMPPHLILENKKGMFVENLEFVTNLMDMFFGLQLSDRHHVR